MKAFVFLLFSLISVPLMAQNFINGSISHDGIIRKYLLYVPQIYDGSEARPLVLNFHGFGSNATQQALYGDFRPMADTANFLIVIPEGTLFNGVQHWNVGGFTTGSTVDDVGFASALIDSLAASYNIDLGRVYSTGMSNGGYMSYRLACELSDRIVAIASVTGSMTPAISANCNPEHPMPVMQIHGTADATVPYNGASFSLSMQDVLDYWVGFNECQIPADTTALPDVNPTDGSTAEWIVFEGGENGSTVEHIKIFEGGHTWPGSFIPLPATNRDFSASEVIWDFFSRYDLESLGGVVNVSDYQELVLRTDLRLYPNPASSLVFIDLEDSLGQEYRILDSRGMLIQSGILSAAPLDVTHLADGLYSLITGNSIGRLVVIH